MNFTGINATTGRAMTGADHLKQSIRDILTTRIGTRVMRRQYGSRLPELVDNPMSEALKADLFAESAQALARWEPRFRLDRVYLESASPEGRIVIGIEGRILINDEIITLEGIEIK
jgi:phage baseplate assembly protein W